jgi:hypothetical protein
LIKDEKGDLLADSHAIVNRWKNYFSKLFMHKDILVPKHHTMMSLRGSEGKALLQYMDKWSAS